MMLRSPFHIPLLFSVALAVSACVSTGGSNVGANYGGAGPDNPDAVAQPLAFAPLNGPPQPVADQLAQAFATAAVSRGLSLAPYRQRRSAYVVKGYITVVPGKNGTTAVYVWDVLSPDLQRLHRISGQSTDRQRADDPWTALSPATLQSIADNTADELTIWLAAR